MRNLDRTAIEKFGIEDKLLMENAGLATFGVIQSKIGCKGQEVCCILRCRKQWW